MVFHALCVALVFVDIAARSLRIGIVLSAMGARIPRKDAWTLTMFGDAAAALTPWRMGGEPARAFGAVQGGTTTTTAVIGLGLESIVVYGVLALLGAGLGAAFGSEWAHAVRGGGAAVATPAVWITVALLVILAVLVLYRMPAHIVDRAIAAVRDAVRQLRAAPRGELALLVILSLVSLAARVAILPLVAIAFHASVPLGVLIVASFGLVNGQVLMPTPSGAGAVELAAAAGVMGTRLHTGAILGAWRVYITVLPIAAGLAAAAWRYGRGSIMRVLWRRS